VLLKTILIAVAIAMTVPAWAQQPQRGITIISPDSVHVYSVDPATPGRLLDDKNLQLQNERQQRERLMREMELDRQAERQQLLDGENSN
jgi:hypothetical protein